MQVRPSSSPQATATVVTVIALEAGPETQSPDVNGQWTSRQRTSQRCDRAGKELIVSVVVS